MGGEEEGKVTNPTEEGAAQNQEGAGEGAGTPPGEGPGASHEERSMLGRRVSRIERGLQSFMDEMRASIGQITARPTERARETSPADEDETIPLTRKDLRQFLRQEYSAIDSEKAQYQTQYTKALATLGLDLEDAEHEAVLTELVNNPQVNVRRTGDPKADAEINFEKAQNIVLRKRYAKPGKTNPLKGGDASNLGGPSGGDLSPDTQTGPVKLDPAAAEFVGRVGWDTKKVGAVLSGETPLALRGKMT